MIKEHKKLYVIFLVLLIASIIISVFVARHLFGRNEQIGLLEKRIMEMQEKVQNEKYEFASVSRGEVVQTIEVDGTVVSDSEVDLSFQVSGRLDNIYKSEGDFVAKGDVIAELDSTDYLIILQQRQAGLAQAKANLNIAKAGASIEDVKVYETALATAIDTLDSSKESSEKVILSQESQLAAAQVAVTNAEQTIEDIRTQNIIDIKNAYDSSDTLIESSLSSIESALDASADIYDMDELENILSAKNKEYIKDYNDNYSTANLSFTKLDSNLGVKDTDELLLDLGDTLELTLDTLNSLYNALVNTVAGSNLSQTELESLKAEVNTLRSSINLAISKTEAASQSIVLIETAANTKLNNAMAALASAQAAVSSAEANLQAARANAASSIRQAENAVEAARDKLELIQAGPREEDIAYLEAVVYEADAGLALAKENLEKTKIYAPIDGTITNLEASIGENINMSSIFCSLISASKQIEAIVPETEIGKVQIKQKAEIEFDAYKDEIFGASVVSIDPSETVKQGMVYYQIKLLLDKQEEKNIMPGMTVEASIETAKREDVVRLEKSLLKQDEEGYYVEILEGREEKEIPVQIGLTGDDFVEIVSGVNEEARLISFYKGK